MAQAWNTWLLEYESLPEWYHIDKNDKTFIMNLMTGNEEIGHY